MTTALVHGFRLVLLLLVFPHAVLAAQNDWAEGTAERSDGATRDYYNRAALLRWENLMGDWRDADGIAQGNRPFSTADVTVDRQPKMVQWDVTALVQQWRDHTHPNQGLFLRVVEGSGAFHFHSREFDQPDQHPILVLFTELGTHTLRPVADTYLDRSTYRGMGDSPSLRVNNGENNKNHALLRFDFETQPIEAPVVKATLQMHCFAQFGSRSTIGVFRCSQGHDEASSEPQLGLAHRHSDLRSIANDPDVLFIADFETDDWRESWTVAEGQVAVIETDPERRFEPLQGRALRVGMAQGTHTGLNFAWKFGKEAGAEPDEIYFRYDLRLGDDWNATIQGGKMPGLSGTYGVAGWGGRRSDGTNGWSARGAFAPSIPANNPLGGTHPIGTYCYHADMPGRYGDVWLWQRNYRGYLVTNRWYSIEQHVKLNSPGQTDGILRAWVDGHLAFEKTDIRFRHTPELRIEQVWMNVYHGGSEPSPHDQHLFIDNVIVSRQYIGPR